MCVCVCVCVCGGGEELILKTKNETLVVVRGCSHITYKLHLFEHKYSDIVIDHGI